MSNVFSRLPLQSKVSSTLLLTMAVFAAISYAILKSVITPAFDNLELSAAKTNLVRAEQAIRAEIGNLEAVTADWAFWDDIYEYVSGRYPTFQKSNLDRPTLENLGLDIMAIFALDSELMWAQVLTGEIERSLDELGILQPEARAFAQLTAHQDPEDWTVGIVNSALGPMIISSSPILRSDDSGPVAGALVMAQFLNDARLERLRERTEVQMSWTLTADFPARGRDDPGFVDDGEIHVEADATTVFSHRVLRDIFGEPILVLSVATPRRITALGQQTVTAAMLFLLSAGVFAMIVMWFLLRGTILRPIKSLARHMDKIRESGDLSHRIALDRQDEVGALATQFDDLTSEVHEARKALLYQSFKAGKADTAAEVLHNIRNAMTPMINGVERVTKAFRVADELRVAEATGQLRQSDCPEDRAEKLTDYIDASFNHIKAVCNEAAEDMKIVTSQAHQIEGILTVQEKFASVDQTAEDIVVEEVVGEAAHVIPKARKSDIDVDFDEDLPRYRVRAHRIGLLQVLGNLILNAYESIERRKPSKGRIFLTAADALLDDLPMVQLTVSDNGCGFDSEVSKQIFQRGFSSKPTRDSGGLGLHWCANAVAGMGGRILAESAGDGQGAEFHVLLPAVQGGSR